MSRKKFGENYLSAILLVIQLFPREPDLVKCCERSGGLADIAALATWFLFGKLFGVATLVGFGEKRRRKNLSLCGLCARISTLPVPRWLLFS